MTEADILAQITAYGDQISASMQYWTSVSFGVLVAAHLTRGQVSGFIVAVALIFYIGFSSNTIYPADNSRCSNKDNDQGLDN